jgi:hypothetical protein
MPKTHKITAKPSRSVSGYIWTALLGVDADGNTGNLIVGNLLDIPPKHSWLTFKSWADQYGPIFRIRVMRRNIVVVSTEKIANDLLRERGTLYSSREQLSMAAKLLSRDLRPLLLPYGGSLSMKMLPAFN